MLYNCYLRKGTVYIPTIGKRGGAYTDIEPVGVVPAANTDGLRRALLEAIGRGNVAIPLLKGKHPPPVVQKYAGVNSWSAFARNASSWTIKDKSGSYQIVGYRTHSEGYWVEDPNQKVEFPPGITIDAVIDRMIVILQEAARSLSPAGRGEQTVTG
jgi:hypothetical protein